MFRKGVTDVEYVGGREDVIGREASAHTQHPAQRINSLESIDTTKRNEGDFTQTFQMLPGATHHHRRHRRFSRLSPAH